MYGGAHEEEVPARVYVRNGLQAHQGFSNHGARATREPDSIQQYPLLQQTFHASIYRPLHGLEAAS